MDHSLQSYLERQTTRRLLSLLTAYPADAEDLDGCIRQMILQVLAKRGITSPNE